VELTEPASVRVAAGAMTLRCLLWGEAGDPAVVLLHGNGGHAHWWTPLVPALVPGWRVIAPDLRGHGESDWAEPPSYRMADFAADLEPLLGALAPGPMVLAGHSMGGRIAAWCALAHPGRVRGLALLDTRMQPGRPETAAAWRARVSGTRRGRRYPTREAALAAFRFVPDEPDVPAPVAAFLAGHAVVELGPGAWTYRFDRAVLALEGDGAGDLTPALARVGCPVTLMAGEASWVMDASERAALARAIPRSTVRVFPGGHHFLVSHPEPVGAALRAFLDGLR
jgi:pimeloyl-ACP methyl ester carboxylesterase